VKDRDLYSIEETRQRLGGISRNTVYAMLRSGQLSSVVLGCRRFISAKAIADLIAAGVTSVSPAKDCARARKQAQACLPIPLADPIQQPRRETRR
jgi:hypothetical protein